MKINKNKGISLIVLVITIIVVIILAGSIIISLSSNNPISQASKATYKSDVSNFQTELSLYKTKEYTDALGDYFPKTLQADETSITYNDVKDSNKSIYDLVPTLKQNEKYAGQFGVVDGQLVFYGLDESKQNWAMESGLDVITIGEIGVTIFPPSQMVVVSGTDITYTVKFVSNVALDTINLSDKVELVDDAGVALTTQPTIVVGDATGTNLDTIRQVTVTIKTNNLIMGSYKLKIKPSSVMDINDITNLQDSISSIAFDISDNIPPVNPTMSADVTGWTNGNVAVTIVYSEDSSVKQYSIDGTSWNNYTIPVVVTDNNTKVYAKGIDAAENESGQSTLTVSNIDKVVPTVTYGTNGATSITTASTTVTVSDIGESGINTSTLQYIWDTQNVSAPASGWVAFTNEATLTKSTPSGTYYLWIKASDNAGNNLVSKTNSFTIISEPVINNFGYTGGVQTYKVPYTGIYKLQTWGASGGNNGGRGAYATGTISLIKDQIISIYVGGIGQYTAGGYNGGGSAGTGTAYGRPYGGGGATDIRINGTALANRVIVAGGGGGGQDFSVGGYATYQYLAVAGDAGGTGSAFSGTTWCCGGPGGGATQTSGGSGGTVYGNATSPGGTGSLGQGGYGSNNNYEGGAGGGGGYYGGGGGAGGCGGPAGGGGSSYIGSLSNASASSGNISFIAPSGSNETGHVGHGYARITIL